MTTNDEQQAMSAEEAVESGPARCGATTRSGHPCRRYAGSGTEHVGFGNCKLHGGSTRNGRIHGQRERLKAVTESPIGGFDAIERGLAIVNGLVNALDRELEKIEGGVLSGAELHATVRLTRDAARDLATIGKLAADAGLDERRLRLEEEKLSLLAATLRAVFADPELGLDAAQQDVAARVTARRLRELAA